MGLEQSLLKLRDKDQNCNPDDDEETGPWSIVDDVTLTSWKHGAGERWGFDMQDDMYSHGLRVVKKPWSPFTVLGRQSNGRMYKLCQFPCEVFETGREERVSWWIKDMSVLAVNSRAVVIQLVLSKTVKILMVDWTMDRLMGSYTFTYHDEPCLQECYISPDSSMLLLRQNIHLRRCIGHLTGYDSRIRVVKQSNGLLQRIYTIEDNLAAGCFGSGLSFDPRFPSHVAMITSAVPGADGDEDYGIDVYDLVTERIVQQGPACTDRLVHHACHSPDGTLMAVLCVNMSRAMCAAIFIDSVKLVSTESLVVIQCLMFPDCSPCKLVPLRSFPIFSRNGQHLAALQVTDGCHVLVYSVPLSDTSLQNQCRTTILQQVQKKHIKHLPLPTFLKEYLSFGVKTSYS